DANTEPERHLGSRQATRLRDRRSPAQQSALLRVRPLHRTAERHSVLRNASVPQTAGLSLPRENIGVVANRGWDGSISWRQQLESDVSFEATFNGGYAQNKILFWDEAPGAPPWQQSTGFRMNTGLYYKAIGVFKDQAAVDAYQHWAGARPGDVIFEDVNGA